MTARPDSPDNASPLVTAAQAATGEVRSSSPTGPGRRRRGVSRGQVLLAIWTALVLAFLYLPILPLVVYSFNTSRLNVVWRGFTLGWYRQLRADKPLVDAAVNSLIVASAATVLSVFLGTAGAWALHRYRFPLAGGMRLLIAVPLVIPEVIMGVSLLIFFAVTDAFGNALFARLGWGDDHLGLGFTTVIIGHVTFCFPFVLAAVQARLAGMDPSMEEAALDLGATPARALLRVIVPYLLPAIVSGGLMAFTLSMDELIVTYFINGPSSTTLPLRVFGMVRQGLSPELNAVSTVFVVATAALVIPASRLAGRDAPTRSLR